MPPAMRYLGRDLASPLRASGDKADASEVVDEALDSVDLEVDVEVVRDDVDEDARVGSCVELEMPVDSLEEGIRGMDINISILSDMANKEEVDSYMYPRYVLNALRCDVMGKQGGSSLSRTSLSEMR